MAHILVVDDLPTNRNFLVTLLGYFGHSFSEAGDGVEALAQLRNRIPDLVITDLLMPNMDGEEFTRRLRIDPATTAIPVIMFTATYRVREARTIANRVGVHQVLAKPSLPQAIIAAVAEALGKAGAVAQPATTASDAEAASNGAAFVPAGNLDAVTQLNLRQAELLSTAIQIADEPAQPLSANRPLDQALREAQSLGLRLTGLIELGLDIATVRDPRELTALFCPAVQAIMSARYAGIVLPGGKDGSAREFVARGLDDATGKRVALEIADCPAAKRVLGQDGAGRLVLGVHPGDVTGLPASHPPVKNFLACPIAAQDYQVGWMYVADRLGDAGFATDDQRIMMALAAQFAIAWNSLAKAN